MEGNDGVISFSIAYYISEWVIRLIMLEVVIRRRRPDSAMAWLLVIFFLPWPGLFAYWLIGENRLPRRHQRQDRPIQQRATGVVEEAGGVAVHREVQLPLDLLAAGDLGILADGLRQRATRVGQAVARIAVHLRVQVPGHLFAPFSAHEPAAAKAFLVATRTRVLR